MGRSPCCTKEDGLNKGAWTALEDKILTDFIKANGEGKWRSIPKKAGLKRCGKSCRLRWLNYLRPDIKRGNITSDEEDLIVRLHKLLGNRWSLIAGRLPGRTDNEIKNYWNSNLAKKEQRKYVLQRSPIKEKTPVASVTQEKTPKLVSVGPSVLHDSQVIAPMEPTLLAPAVPAPVVSCEMVNSVQLSGYESSNVSSPASMSLEDPNAELTKDSTVGDLQITEIHDFTDFRFTEFGVAQLDVVKEENVNNQCIESDNNVGSSGGQAHWFSIERLMMDNWAFDIETNLDLGTLDSIPHTADDWII